MNYTDPKMVKFENACAMALLNISRSIIQIEQGVSGTKEVRDEVNCELDKLFDVYRETE
jgi:hypothetical protein